MLVQNLIASVLAMSDPLESMIHRLGKLLLLVLLLVRLLGGRHLLVLSLQEHE